jgi:glutathione S-transferase
MSEIILHHYDRSPFSEKVRLVFGLKGISWRSVEIPRWMPKPDLMPLTGGYRKTPVMQIGADIYCDTRCMLREIDRRFPKPSLFGAGGGDLIAAWADSTLFTNAVGIVFGSYADQFPKELKEDRHKFTAGMFDADRMKAHQPAIRAQFRAHARWIENSLADGRAYLLGAAPNIADFALYHTQWFVRGNMKEPDFLAGCEATKAWYERMAKFGHGTKSPLDAKEALAIAKAANPAPVKPGAVMDMSGRKPGEQVIVVANDYGRDPVAGELLSIDESEITIRRRDPQAGELNLHFPRVGFDVMMAG